MTEEFAKRLVRALFSGAMFGFGIGIIATVAFSGQSDDPAGTAAVFGALSLALAGIVGVACAVAVAIWHAALWAWRESE